MLTSFTIRACECSMSRVVHILLASHASHLACLLGSSIIKRSVFTVYEGKASNVCPI